MQSEAPRQCSASNLRGTGVAWSAAPVRFGLWALVGLLAGFSPALAQEFSAAGPTKIRLIDAGAQDGARYALVEIALGEAVTYWRNPGDSGVAPLFDFAGSQNLAEADALYPQPRAIDEAGAKIFGYRGEARFPIRVAAADPTQPIHLALALDYAACDQICRPIHVQLEAELAARPPTEDPTLTETLAETLAHVPKALDRDAAAPLFDIAPLPAIDQKPRWRLTPKSPAEDMFVEAPEGFFLETARDGDGFILTLVEHPAKKPLPQSPARITLAGATPVEFDLLLPRPTP